MKYELINEPNKNISAITQVLLNRGITDPFHYLNTTIEDIIPSVQLDNIEKGAKLLITHIAQGSKVMIQVDSDYDGYASSAILINYLNNLFPAFVQNNISYRMHEGKQHGIVLETIPKDVKLVICPDSSSMDYEQHKELADQGIDILVLDHHEAPEVSQYACVINNQLCNYPNKFLCGAGIVYKFCSYLDSIMETDYANNYLDLVATALIADMIDLRSYETRYLIDTGLKNISNPYLKGMVLKNDYSLGGNITPFGIAFYIAPYVNAVTRSGTIEEKTLLFESMLEYKAYESIPSTKRGHKPGDTEIRVEQACRVCGNVKNRQTKIRDTNLDLIDKLIQDRNLLNNKIILVLLDEDQKTTLAGLIANQLMSIYEKPVLILNKTELGYEGSFRGPNIPGLESAKDFFEASGLVEYTAGHANAGGLGLRQENIKAFIDYCNTALADFDFIPSYKVDFIIDAKNIQYYKSIFFDLMDSNYLWGQELNQPLIAIENLVITKDNITLMKGTTLKIISNDLSFIKFKSSDQEFEVLSPQALGSITINVIGVCEKNTYNDLPQIIIKDYEIIDRQEYYF